MLVHSKRLSAQNTRVINLTWIIFMTIRFVDDLMLSLLGVAVKY